MALFGRPDLFNLISPGASQKLHCAPRCATIVFYEVWATLRYETIVFYEALPPPRHETIVFYEALPPLRCETIVFYEI